MILPRGILLVVELVPLLVVELAGKGKEALMLIIGSEIVKIVAPTFTTDTKDASHST